MNIFFQVFMKLTLHKSLRNKQRPRVKFQEHNQQIKKDNRQNNLQIFLPKSKTCKLLTCSCFSDLAKQEHNKKFL